MSIFQPPDHPCTPELHVFELAEGWHWGITIPRARGCGFKLIAFSQRTFPAQEAARVDGSQAIARLTDIGIRT
jgi:hypothetical protein